MKPISFQASELAEQVQGELRGADICVRGIATLKSASTDQLSFLSNSRYLQDMISSSAGVVLVSARDADAAPNSAIVVADPYLAYAQLSRLFCGVKQPLSGIDPDALISAQARVSASATVGAGAVVEAGAELGERVYIGPNTVVGHSSVIDADTRIEANVTLYPGVIIGQRCLIHSGAVIGSDGFGFAPDGPHWCKIEQLGSVVIGDDVEIGACTTIDRGALDNTLIESGVKLDNQIQIAHNVVIGENSAIAGGCAVAGSTRIGKQCTIAGMSGITGHLEIADGTHITAMTLISHSIREAGVYSSGTAMEPHRQWKRNAVRFRQLDELTKRISELEQLVKQLSSEGQK